MRFRKHIDLSHCALSLGILKAACALALAAPLMAGPARAEFGDPVTLSRAGESAVTPQVAVDATGDALVVWARSDGTDIRIQARARSAAGVLGPIETLSRAGQDALEPQVGIDADGNALVVWTQSDGTTDRIWARARSAAGVLGPVLALSKAGETAASPQVAVNAAGDALFVWTRFDGTRFRIQARARSAAGVLGTAQTLSAASGEGAFTPQVAIDDDGRTLVVWRVGNLADFLIQARSRSAAGVLGPIEKVSQNGQVVSDPQVVITGSGDALLVWLRSEGNNAQVHARARSAAGTLGPVQDISDADERARPARVAIDADGDALIVWERSVVMNRQVKARARSAAGALGPVQRISPKGDNAFDPSVAINAGGRAQIVWRLIGETSERIQARSRSAGGALGPVQNLSQASIGTTNPQVAIGGNGDALAVWERFDQNVETRIQAAAGP
jgi:hypothetical protein